MKYKVGDKVAVRGEVKHVGQDCYYIVLESRGWTRKESLINPLSAINTTKAYKMHFNRVKRERDEARKDAAMWRERFDKLAKLSGDRSLQHKEEMLKEQESYAALAREYISSMRKEKAWKGSYFILLATLIIVTYANIWIL